MTSPSYEQLKELSTSASILSGISMLLEWDQEIYMPKGAIEIRSRQIELIADLHHREQTSKQFGELLGSLINLETGAVSDASLTHPQKAALREWRRDYLQQVKLPQEFVKEWARATSAATHGWIEARDKDDFSLFQPHLKKVVDLARKKADYLGYESHPYDALIDSFEPEVKTETLLPLFERLKLPLTNLLKEIQTKHSPDRSFFEKDYSHEKQLAFGRKILADMGFDPAFSRLDESSHPMCVPIHPSDMRMSTRVYPKDVAVNILSCLHEGGHGLYNSHVPVEHFGTPLCQSASLAMDESQSRTWETIIGRGLPFWKHYYPLLQKEFPEQLGAVHLEDFYQGLNIVQPSYIRTDSDEVSYNLHILIRFELELALIEGTIEVADIPEAWNEKMRSYFGLTPPSPALGCLQDIHWSLGAIGYFPTYTLGNLYAAQLFETFSQAVPDWKNRIAKGDLTVLSSWQEEHIHRHGKIYIAKDLCEKVTGKPLSEQPFIDYLEKKYTPLYHL